MDALRKLLIVAAPATGRAIASELEPFQWAAVHADGLEAAQGLMAHHRFGAGLIVLDDAQPFEAAGFEDVLAASADCEWVGVFPPGSQVRRAWRDVILSRLFDHHTFPADIEFLSRSLGHAHGRALLRRAARPDAPGGSREFEPDLGMVGKCEATEALRALVRKAGPSDAPVLIGGESGSGKELVALALHRASRRAKGPFITVNCGSLAPTLIHSELFGHERGSFTGAASGRKGLIEMAHGGTLFLDEIAELPIDLQAMLLRFLQEKKIVRVGSGRETAADTRVLAASHVDLHKAVELGHFRHDLYFRLSVLVLQVPALRERAADIPLLARHFHDQFRRERPTRTIGFHPDALVALLAHAWPGNIRELHNRVQRATVMADGRLIRPADLGLAAPAVLPNDGLQEIRVQAEKSAICLTLQRVSHNVTQAARDLGVSRMTLYRLMAKHSIVAGPY